VRFNYFQEENNSMQAATPYDVRIVSTGRYLPKRKVTAGELDDRLSLEPGTAFKLTGAATRHYVNGERASDMGAAAARDALTNAGLTLADVDLILCASGVAEQPIPSNAALVQKKLGDEAAGKPCFDVGATCMGFMVGLDVASSLITSGRFKRILLVSADIASCGLNDRQTESAVLFGDAAAAAVLAPSDPADQPRPSKILAMRYETYAEGSAFTEIRGGGSAIPAYRYTEETRNDFLFDMQGPKVFRMAARVLPPIFEQTLAAAGLTVDQIDLFIPHQASALALEVMRRRLNLDGSRVVNTLHKYGNTIASSLPLAIDDCIRERRLSRGQKVVLVATAAGFSVGVTVLEF
jgi:3-oxoacyl-[acyl-carrier-protein] synthase-3